jgi:hypothetical protein
MFRQTLDSNFESVIAQQIATLEAIPGIFEEELLDIGANVVEPRLVEIADTAPARGNNPFIWSQDAVKNANARRTWFWLVKTGKVQTDGRHYQRQGQPPYGLRVDVDRDGHAIFLIIRSTWDKFSLLFGNVLTGRGQLPGHRTTGWAQAQTRINELFFEVNLELIDRVNRRVEALDKQAPFTRGKRR